MDVGTSSFVTQNSYIFTPTLDLGTYSDSTS